MSSKTYLECFSVYILIKKNNSNRDEPCNSYDMFL